MKSPSKEEHLFTIIEKIGEILDGPLHIIDNRDPRENEGSFRVYHSSGYCFDIVKTDITDEEDKKPRYSYDFNAEWPEFAVLDVSCATILINNYLQGSK